MDTTPSTARYEHVDIRALLAQALADAGLDLENLKPGDLQEADHLHLGGSRITDAVARRLQIGAGTRVLDVGCGIGGPARSYARLGAQVTAVDPTPGFVELAIELNQALGLGQSIAVRRAYGHDTGVRTGSIDVAVIMHVGMNIADKPAVFNELHRVLVPGGMLAVYDQMGVNDLPFPVPWADTAEQSHVESVEAYRRYFRQCGFQLHTQLTGGELGLDPGALQGPILLAIETERVAHVREAIGRGLIGPHLLVGTRT